MSRNPYFSNWPILLLLIGGSSWAQDISRGSDQTIPITTRHSAGKKSKEGKARMQVRYTGDSVEIWGFNLKSIPKNLRTIRSKEPSLKLKRKEVQDFVVRSLDRTYDAVSDTTNGFRTKVPTAAGYDIMKNKFINGAGSSAYATKQWIRLASMPGAEPMKSFYTRGRLFKHGMYEVENLPAKVAWQMPPVDPWVCGGPIEAKFFSFRKMEGYGLDKIRLKPYKGRDREIVHKSFELRFERNEAKPNYDELQTVIGYLEQNEYAVLEATLEGASSVEGSKERNATLQRQRARILSEALRRYNETSVRKDTVLLKDTWPEFRSLVLKTSYAWLDTLSDEGILQQLNQNDSIRIALEPILKTQRKAALKLVMVKRLSEEDKLEDIRKALALWSSRLSSSKFSRPDTEAVLMGIIDHLFLKYQRGEMTQEELEELLAETSASDYLHVLLGYHILKQFEDNTFREIDSISWEAYWEKYDIGRWFLNSNSTLIQLLTTTSDKEARRLYLQMYNDYQAYMYRFIELGLFDINTLCTIPFPERPEFFGLILNHYAFLYEMANENGKVVSCIPTRNKNTGGAPGSGEIDIDEFLDNIGSAGTRELARMDDHFFLKPNFNTTEKGAYYFLLKQYFVKGNKEILKWTVTSAGGNAQLEMVNLFHLLTMNLSEFDPFENHFYDKDIQLEELDKLVAQMKKRDDGICVPQINGLYLEYHLNALYYLERYFSPGNEKQCKIADASLAYITEYYKKRSAAISSRLALHIVEQMNLFNWLPGARPGAWYGYDLLNAIARQRALSDDELKLFAHYKKIYDPQIRNALPFTVTKERVVELWEVEY